MNIDKNYLLVVAGLMAIVLELVLGVATGFDLLLVGVALIIGGVVGMVTGNFMTALIVVGILLLLYFFVGRSFLKKNLTIKTTLTNSDKLINKEGIVLKTILPNKPGQVKVDGEIWRAESGKKISEGEVVIINSYSGVTLKVTAK